MLPAEERSRLDGLSRELDVLKKKPPRDIPRAVVVQDGGPKGTRHEGFKDAHVFLRGNSKRLGKTVPRGVPRVLHGDGEPPVRINEGSGRRELADWLARPDNPLTARVMVNRIWQHHFGEGLVRTPNDFGERGERPSNPELLDWLAARFVESGWSVKAMHRLIMLSSAYQQSSRAGAAGAGQRPGQSPVRTNEPPPARCGSDPRQPAGRGRPARRHVRGARRSRTWPYRAGPCTFSPCAPAPSATDFGRLFDRADPGSIVAERGESVVAPQALFFLNDPFVSEMARALAARIAREEPEATRGPHPPALRPRPGPAAVAGRARPRPAAPGRGRRRRPMGTVLPVDLVPE